MLAVSMQKRRGGLWSAVAAGGLLLACTSCAHSPHLGSMLQVRGAAPSANGDLPATSPPAKSHPASDGWTATGEGKPSVGVRHLSDGDGWQSPEMHHTEAVSSSPGRASVPLCEPLADERCFYPADPRVPLPSGPPCPQPGPSGWCEGGPLPAPLYEPDFYPEEYLCDGGDRGIRVYYDEVGRHGLETEDTVAEFTDDTGHRHIRPSTRTCIYAPQFAAVRSASLPYVNLSVDQLAGAHDHRATGGLRTRLSPDVQLQQNEAVGFDGRLRASGIDVDLIDRSVAQVHATAQHLKLYNLFEDRLYLAGEQLEQVDIALLHQAAQRAGEWTRDVNPVIVATDVAGQEVYAEFHVEEFVEAEDRSRKGDLKIVKLADESAALPGDVVTFTIRYENVGDRELRRIRIIDNLTPRLELFRDSLQSDREGEFSVEDNYEGSVVLTFQLGEPLPGKTGGTLTFQCRVR